jgi:hypothetical protein
VDAEEATMFELLGRVRLPAATALCLALFMSGGCGLAYTKGPPAGHEHLNSFDCTESKVGPISDFVWAGLTVASTVLVLAEEDGYWYSEGEKTQAILGGIAWTGLSTASGVVGLRRVSRCREARQLLAERLALQEQRRADPSPLEAGITVHTVQVSPQTSSIRVGEQLQLSASAIDSEGMRILIRSFDWTSSNTAVASVDADGLVTARAPGRVMIAANIQGVVGTAEVVVTE